MIKIFIAGDSTAATYDDSQYPMQGWGQSLQGLINNIKVENRALCGSSSKSFIDAGRLDEIEKELGKGDYLFIQFGHNDQKEDEEKHTEPFSSYKRHLQAYLETAQKKSAIPVLLSSVARRKFNEKENLTDTHGDYISAVKELATEQNVPFIDMNAKTFEMISDLGMEESKKIFVWVKPNKYNAYLEGAKDDTHLNEQGALIVANLVVEGIIENNLMIKYYVK